jgi:hypothetical protein
MKSGYVCANRCVEMCIYIRKHDSIDRHSKVVEAVKLIKSGSVNICLAPADVKHAKPLPE